ncbi:hypothetical protein CG51_10665 [Haematobacter missouriensis]|uniref:Uncharacterized protein n=1 Tax=Haematobacter missouriensis TaxID=366616 RepID=A0A212AV23_9RHOB|nr:hypothetical protein CG51_10665 [Haematobacter missouriensis]OWJ72227.1 hypothetical protein CDV53_17710 [Haematobacter missouriensis]OWJ85337.1 hypothetical protein CDV52_05265 [Haematobacter missouriensis]
MAVAALLPAPAVATPENEERDVQLTATLNRLRLLSLRCRAARRIDVFSACALLAMDRVEAAQAFAEALLRALPQATGKPSNFLFPGSRERSFDESWLLRLLEAVRHGDGDSTIFLIASQVRKPYRRQVAYLAKGLAEGLDTI